MKNLLIVGLMIGLLGLGFFGCSKGNQSTVVGNPTGDKPSDPGEGKNSENINQFGVGNFGTATFE